MMLPDDAVTHCEPEACALPDRLRGVERLEDMRECLLVHACPVIADDDLDVLAGGHGSRQDDGAVDQHAIPGPHREPAAIGHRVARIHHDVHEHLFELRTIGTDMPECIAEGHAQRDIGTDEA